ncbi:MAG: CHASE2 domain-containing protein [Cytophagales bacterium]
MSRKILLWLVSAIHAIFLIVVSYYWHKQPFLYDEELTLLRISSYFKRLVLHIDNKPDLSKYLFIDISWEKMLVDKYDEYGFPIGKEAVTSRPVLLEFFKRVSNFDEGPKFIVCDIFFDVPTDYDRDLEKEINKFDNILCVSLYDSQYDTAFYPVLDVPTATTSFETSEGVFLKTKLVFADSIKTLPVQLYEYTEGKKLRADDHFNWSTFRINLNSFVVDHGVRNYDLFESEITRKVYLSELLLLDDESIEKIVKDKLIFIGDYEDNDLVETIYGDLPGPIILVNIYNSIINKANQINALFIVYLLLGYFFVSYICFSNDSIFDILTDKLSSKYKINADLLSFGGYLLYFFLMSFISYLIFDFILTILLFSLYMEIFERLKTMFEKYVLVHFFKLNS